MTRRYFIAGAGWAAAALGATPDPAAEAWDVVATMAAALSEPNDAAFMKPIAKSVPGYERLERQIRALVHTNEVFSSVSPVVNDGDDKQRRLDVDWYMEIQPQAEGRAAMRRRETIKLTLVKSSKGWTITAIDPVTFFTAPS